jgi:tetratricopeptide (TPR) repeat protein
MRAVIYFTILCFPAAGLLALDLDTCREKFGAGDYEECLKLCETAIRDKLPQESWRLLLAETCLTLGRLEQARTVINESVDRYPTSIRSRWLGATIFEQSGQQARAERLLDELIVFLRSDPYIYRNPVNMVLLGRTALRRGNDPKQVLEKLYEAAKRSDPDCREAYLAIGDLALEKSDFELAKKNSQEGARRFSNDPDFLVGLARAYAPTDRKQSLKFLEETLQKNPHHIPALLMLVNHAIDGEDYAEAEKFLKRIEQINPRHPEAWACRAVLKRLENDPAGARESRATALKDWPTNPKVDYLVGLKLSQKYRFAEGSEHQQLALQMDAKYRPAAMQLAQDFLRLGREAEGWRLVEETCRVDPYNVAAYNLTILKENLTKYATLTNQNFRVRMSASEAAVYGHRVLDLLARARTQLSERYGYAPTEPVLVDLFADAKDFEVRTFGMPENSGYLGVCFGSVITANSPAAPTSRAANWESMLWHEFTHVVTLQMTKNQMPRWLSEGISVFEEEQANPAWGQRLNPRMREMILGDEFVPLSKLSTAFLTATDRLHLQFAYCESSLAVAFLVEQYGLDAMKRLLRALGAGVALDKAIATNLAPLRQVDSLFDRFVHKKALKYGGQLDWQKPPSEILGSERADGLDQWLAEHPTNYWALTTQATRLVTGGQWQAAKIPLTKLIQLFPENTGSDNPYRLLATVHRSLQDTNAEMKILAEWSVRDAEAVDAYLRLMDQASAAGDWDVVATNAERYLAVSPMVIPPWRHLAVASEAAGRPDQAVAAYRRLLLLDPPDPAIIHYRLASLLVGKDDTAAKLHVLQALEEAPRFRDAQKLLLQIKDRETGKPANQPPPDRQGAL